MKYDVNRSIKADKSLPEGIADRLPDGIKNERERREFFMSQALLMAKRSCASDDVPVGCVIVRHDEIIAAACNEREKEKCALRHAEATAIERASRALRGWRLVAFLALVTAVGCASCTSPSSRARCAPGRLRARESPSSSTARAIKRAARWEVCSTSSKRR